MWAEVRSKVCLARTRIESEDNNRYLSEKCFFNLPSIDLSSYDNKVGNKSIKSTKYFKVVK